MSKRARGTGTAARWAEGQPLEKVREEAERQHILSILRLTNGNRAQAARLLGISRKTLWKKMKHLGTRYPSEVTEW
jgi:DNA-binding NtrC family response regulator